MTRFALALGLVLSGLAGPALAHHPMGGTTPETLMHGLLSGLGHPVIGIDHFAFVVAVGIAAVLAGARFAAPLSFVGGTVAGCLLLASGVALPFAELAIGASVLALGAALALGRMPTKGVLLALFALAGLFHGGAYGAAIVGAETTPLLAYLVGFAAVQTAIAVAAGWLAVDLGARAAQTLRPRLAGAAVAGIGLTVLVETVEAMVFV